MTIRRGIRLERGTRVEKLQKGMEIEGKHESTERGGSTEARAQDKEMRTESR